MMFRLCAGFGGAVLLFGVLCLVLLNNFVTAAPQQTAPFTVEELVNLGITPAAATRIVPPAINTNPIDQL